MRGFFFGISFYCVILSAGIIPKLGLLIQLKNIRHILLFF